jgi:phage/plasmid-like protein (TIGR03299 family)
MPDNINYNEKTGKHSFFSVQEMPWHGLGQIVEEHPTSAAAIEFAGLNYSVEKRKLFTFDNENQNADPETGIIIPEVEVDNYFATVRMDTDQVLGVVGKDYEVIQNVDAFNFLDAIVGPDGIRYETVGGLGKGERIFITAKLPGYIRVGDNDLTEKYLFVTTSHDGYGSITAAFTPIRIVCNNTLTAALRNCTGAIKIRHTANAKDRLAEAHRVLGISNKLTGELEGVLNDWAKIRITDQQLYRFIQLAMIPNREVLQTLKEGNLDELSTAFNNVCKDVYEYAMSHPSQLDLTTKGTLYGAYNAITGYFQNIRTYKDGESKLKSMLYGGTAQLRSQKAFSLCTDFAFLGQNALDLK